MGPESAGRVGLAWACRKLDGGDGIGGMQIRIMRLRIKNYYVLYLIAKFRVRRKNWDS